MPCRLGCTRKVYARGLCPPCYKRLLRLEKSGRPADELEPARQSGTYLLCQVDGCDEVVVARGCCRPHYRRLVRHGDPLGGRRTLTGTPEERFHSFVDRSDECWVWADRLHDQGYGVLSVDGAEVLAHRFAYELAVGPIPAGLYVLHSCDNPPCVNPAHLRVGTQADNVADMMERGRGRNQHGVLAS